MKHHQCSWVSKPKGLLFIFSIFQTIFHMFLLTCILYIPGERGEGDSLTAPRRDPGELFLMPEVQQILKRVTGFSIDKIFRTKLTKVHPPKYELLTEKQLAKVLSFGQLSQGLWHYTILLWKSSCMKILCVACVNEPSNSTFAMNHCLVEERLLESFIL